ncbi:lysophospholipase L1-like esterase [Actinoplanes tereljensis]|uniref:SGNH/GDSL hydrolase family protein n=1 Tax=Paractinoplanes tereljensis TaxID=571912 RepID=UPI001940F12F|nr:SGNH/GDSL hydrolase family protein [Actinoplanes tereljensis]
MDYVALGDSYAAGTGSSGSADSCGRRDTSYPARWAAAHDVASYRLVACAAHTAEDLVTEQIPALGAGTDLVTVTVGGNDIGFINAVITCVLLGDDSCLAAMADAASKIDTELAGRLDRAYAAIRAAAPGARVIVLGYPRLFELGSCPGGLSLAKRVAMNDVADRLDAAVAARAAAAGLVYADVRDAFDGHRVCSSDPWLNRVNLFALTSTYHPNDTGYARGYLAELAKITG